MNASLPVKAPLTPAEFAEQGRKYSAILDEGDKKYQTATEGKKNIRRFREERCLLIRLCQYQDEHLRFLSDFNAPFGNNAAEQGAHFAKNKTRVTGGFRSHQGAADHMAIASVIATANETAGFERKIRFLPNHHQKSKPLIMFTMIPAFLHWLDIIFFIIFVDKINDTLVP